MSENIDEQIEALEQYLLELNEAKKHLEVKIQRTEYFLELLK